MNGGGEERDDWEWTAEMQRKKESIVGEMNVRDDWEWSAEMAVKIII